MGFTFHASAQQDYLKPKQSSSEIIVGDLSWAYPESREPKPANASVSIINRSSKPIKSVKLLVVAKDKRGTILQSQGTTIKQLIANDTIRSGSTRHLFFSRAYDNPNINTLEVKETIVEFFNGSLEKIPGSQQQILISEEQTLQKKGY
jgi:hypothetical protein